MILNTHAVVVPLYGEVPRDLQDWVQALQDAGLKVVLVQNNPGHLSNLPVAFHRSEQGPSLIDNQNVGGVAGGFNRGVDAAIAGGADWITLLDQDSRLLQWICTGYGSRGSS